MKLFTEVQTPDAPFSLEPGASVISIGSCFAETIAVRLQSYKFDTLYNPFGTLYNPISISQNIQRAISDYVYSERDLFQYNELHYPLSHATKFFNENPQRTVELISESNEKIRNALQNARLFIITLGTAWAYRLVETGEIVGNCHKLPASLFTRELLSPEDIISSLSELTGMIKEFYPGCNIALTISPVRHVRDNMIQNSRSKASLLYAVGELCEQNPELYYFPSYEILMDELRDYRFYDTSLVQPSDLTKEIIWERFQNAVFSDRAKQFVMRYSPVQKALNHRINSESNNSGFAHRQISRLNELIKQFPEIDFSGEHGYFEKFLLG